MKIEASPEEIGAHLARNPHKHMLTSTSDGIDYEFNHDGGKVIVTQDRRGGRKVAGIQPNNRLQILLKAAQKKRTDKGFKDEPAFVSKEEIKPCFPGDVCHTGKGGVIILMTDEHKALIRRSKESRTARTLRAADEGKAEAAAMKAARDRPPQPKPSQPAKSGNG